MNDLERAHYARHLAAFEKNKPEDVQHWKYISKERGPDGKWRYKYKESDKSNKLTGKTDHEYTFSKEDDAPVNLAGKEPVYKKTPSYDIVDETTGLKFVYDANTGEFKFDWATYGAGENVKTNVEYGGYENGAHVNKHTCEYTRNGKQYKTTVTVSEKDGSLHKMETRDLTNDTVIEKAASKIKNWFKK